MVDICRLSRCGPLRRISIGFRCSLCPHLPASSSLRPPSRLLGSPPRPTLSTPSQRHPTHSSSQLQPLQPSNNDSDIFLNPRRELARLTTSPPLPPLHLLTTSLEVMRGGGTFFGLFAGGADGGGLLLEGRSDSEVARVGERVRDRAEGRVISRSGDAG